MNQANTPLVTIRCTVYNQAKYLRQCLDGFVMQQTTFPYEAIVHDDASTDGSADIIREYAERYPDIIKPVLEEENQYSKGGGVMWKKINAAMHPDSKYIGTSLTARATITGVTRTNCSCRSTFWRATPTTT